MCVLLECPFILRVPNETAVYNPKGPPSAVSSNQSPRRSLEESVKDLEHILQEPLITPVQLRKLASVFVAGTDSPADFIRFRFAMTIAVSSLVLPTCSGRTFFQDSLSST